LFISLDARFLPSVEMTVTTIVTQSFSRGEDCVGTEKTVIPNVCEESQVVHIIDARFFPSVEMTVTAILSQFRGAEGCSILILS